MTVRWCGGGDSILGMRKACLMWDCEELLGRDVSPRGLESSSDHSPSDEKGRGVAGGSHRPAAEFSERRPAYGSI